MPYVPHTPQETQQMLAALGETSLDALFDEIPPRFRVAAPAAHDDALPPPATEAKPVSSSQASTPPPAVPAGGTENDANYRPGTLPHAACNEIALRRLFNERAQSNNLPLCFAGAGAYEHHIPAPVWSIAYRGEFATAYTPYQAEASQGTLQVLYEYQTLLCRLTGMDVTNASLYDGASALVEAVRMAIRTRQRPTGRILVPKTLHPAYRQVLETFLPLQSITLCDVAYDQHTGLIDARSLEAAAHAGADALVLPMPTYFGLLDEVDHWVDWAHARAMQVIAVVNPMLLGVCRPPGEWGAEGADLVCGEGQPLGIPLSGGGPYLGFLCCRTRHIRQLPGRLVGRTSDSRGNPGFVLTLQAREQHIRRAKATSNICTNQGLMVTAATIYMALMGDAGLADTARQCHLNTMDLIAQITRETGLKPSFSGPLFHEFVLDLRQPVALVLERMRRRGILAGVALGEDYPELKQSLLICVTETKTAADRAHYAATLAQALDLRPTPDDFEREALC